MEKLNLNAAMKYCRKEKVGEKKNTLWEILYINIAIENNRYKNLF